MYDVYSCMLELELGLCWRRCNHSGVWVGHLSVELVVAEIERCVDGLEGLEIYVDFLLLPILCQNGASIHH